MVNESMECVEKIACRRPVFLLDCMDARQMAKQEHGACTLESGRLRSLLCKALKEL